VEERRQLGGRQMAILLREPKHGVLHDVERRLFVAHGEHRLLECALLDALQERGKLAAGCQGSAPLLFGAEW
jgi:hypothetical protein